MILNPYKTTLFTIPVTNMYSTILAILVVTTCQGLVFSEKLLVGFLQSFLDKYHEQCRTDNNVTILKNESCLDNVRYLMVDGVRVATDIDKFPNLYYLDIIDPKQPIGFIRSLKQLKGLFLSEAIVDPLSLADKIHLLDNLSFIIYKYNDPLKRKH